MNKFAKRERRNNCDSSANPYFDENNQSTALKILPGDYIVTGEPSDMLITTLGSCVAACIRDPRTGYGGMNHFMLPYSKGRSTWGGTASSLRYGNHAMEILINEILRTGCPREELEIKVFGGGNVMNGSAKIGTDNAKFVLEYLKNEGLRVAVEDLGGDYPRRLLYFPATGVVHRLFLKRATDKTVLNEEEKEYRKIIQSDNPDSDVELFNEQNE